MTVYETQGVSMIQFNLCKPPDLDPENVRVVSRFIGGAFGAKGTFWLHAAFTVLVARELCVVRWRRSLAPTDAKLPRRPTVATIRISV